ncbi:hypothetical protein [Spirosoma lituiforme]
MKNEISKAQKLDSFLNTDDEGFNKLMQAIIEVHTKPGEIIPDDYVIDYMSLLDQIYSFYLKNYARPLTCLEYLAAEGKKRYEAEGDLLMLIDSVLRLLINSPRSSELEQAFILLTNYRHGLSPYDKDPDVLNFCPEFNYDILKKELEKLDDPNEKIEILKGRLRLLTAKWHSLNEFEQGFIEETAFEVKCVNEIERQNIIIQRMTSAAKSKSVVESIKKISQSELAFYWHYLIEKGYRPPFPEGKKEAAYIEVTQPHGLAWKPFQMKYNSLRIRNNRLAHGNIEAIKAVITMLAQYPDAQKLAQDELLIAEGRKPLT